MSFVFFAAAMIRSPAAQALIVNADPTTATSNPAPYTSAPTSSAFSNHGDPGWNYVGAFQINGGNGTGVYVGNGWVLTAGHVSTGGYVTFGTNTYTLTGAPIPLTNPVGISGSPDLKLVHMNGYLPLPDLVIRGTTPGTLTVAVIGTGDDRSGILQNYAPGISGYNWNTTSRIQAWATNTVAGNNILVTSDNVNYTKAFITSFDNLTGEGQAADHDSGGAGFIYNNSQHRWELAGLMIGINNGTTPDGQPGSSAAFGNYTFFADLSAYADQIQVVVPEPASLALLSLASLTLLRRRRA
ncbi:MAG: trypsin-like serine protease [Phycisphaerales bacterium]